MENSTPEKEDLNRNSHLEEYYEPVEEAEDPRFGTIIILRNKYNTDDLIFAKEKLSHSIHDCERDIFQAKERMRLSHDFLLKMIDFSTKTFEGEHPDHPTEYLVTGFYEYPKHDLTTEIAERAHLGRHFSAEELLNIEINILEVLNYLRSFKMIHGDIRPKYICFDPTGNGWHKLVDRLGDPSPPNQVQVNNMRRKESLYMSPALFRALSQKQTKIKHNPYKSDAFSLGLVLLEAGTLKSVQPVYKDKDIDMDQLLVLLEEFLALYEENKMLRESLLWLLDTEEKNRKDPKRILKLLNEMHEEEEQIRLQELEKEGQVYEEARGSDNHVVEIAQYEIVELQLPDGQGSPRQVEEDQALMTQAHQAFLRKTASGSGDIEFSRSDHTEVHIFAHNSQIEETQHVLSSTVYANNKLTLEEAKFEGVSDQLHSKAQSSVKAKADLVKPSQAEKPIFAEEVAVTIEPLVSKHPAQYIDRSNLKFDFVNPPEITHSEVQKSQSPGLPVALPNRQVDARLVSKNPDVPLNYAKPSGNADIPNYRDIPFGYANNIKQLNIDDLINIHKDASLGHNVKSEDTKNTGNEFYETTKIEIEPVKALHPAQYIDKSHLQFDFVHTPVYKYDTNLPPKQAEAKPAPQIKSDQSLEGLKTGSARLSQDPRQEVKVNAGQRSNEHIASNSKPVRYHLGENITSDYTKRFSNESLNLDQYAFRPTIDAQSAPKNILTESKTHQQVVKQDGNSQGVPEYVLRDSRPQQTTERVYVQGQVTAQGTGQVIRYSQSPVETRTAYTEQQQQVSSSQRQGVTSQQEQTQQVSSSQRQGVTSQQDQTRTLPVTTTGQYGTINTQISRFSGFDGQEARQYNVSSYNTQYQSSRDKSQSVISVTPVNPTASTLANYPFKSDARYDNAIASQQPNLKTEYASPQATSVSTTQYYPIQPSTQRIAPAPEEQLRNLNQTLAQHTNTLKTVQSLNNIHDPTSSVQKQTQFVIDPNHNIQNPVDIRSFQSIQPQSGIVRQPQTTTNTTQNYRTETSTRVDGKPFDYDIIQSQDGSKRYVLKSSANPSLPDRATYSTQQNSYSTQQNSYSTQQNVISQQNTSPPQATIYHSSRSVNYNISPMSFAKTINVPSQQEIVTESRNPDVGFIRTFTQDYNSQQSARRVVPGVLDVNESRGLNLSYQPGSSTQSGYVANNVRPSATFVNAIIPNIVPRQN